MVAPQIFRILTEFKFDIASAAINSQAIRGEIEKLNATVDALQASAAGAAQSFLYSFGLGGGILGLLTKSVMVAEDFNAAQRALNATFLANRENFTGPLDDLKKMDLITASILGNISDTAIAFGLPEKVLQNQVKGFANMLAPKGLAGTNLDIPIELGKNLLKSAPSLGIDPDLIQGQLMDMLSGFASRGGRLWQRLSAETTAFKPFQDPKRFNALPEARRVEVLREGLAQFATAIVKAEDPLNTLTGQLNNFKTILTGANSILLPIGEVFRRLGVELLTRVNQSLNGLVRVVIKTFAGNLSRLAPDLEKGFVNIFQAMQLPKDILRAGGAMAKFGLMEGVLGILGMFSKGIRGAMLPLQIFGTFFIAAFETWGRMLESSPILQGVMKFLTAMTKVGAVTLAVAGILYKFNKLGIVLKAIGSVLPVFGFFLIIFQAISRAVAKANLDGIKFVDAFGVRLVQILDEIGKGIMLILSPVNLLIDFLSDIIKPLFDIQTGGNFFLYLLDKMAGLLTYLGSRITFFMAAWSGFFASLTQLTANFMGLFSARGISGLMDKDALGLIFNGVVDSFAQGTNDFVKRAQEKINSEQGLFSSITNVSIGKVEIKNSFKDAADPDRIAFTIQDQLIKAALNPTGARNQSFASVLLDQSVMRAH